MKFKLVWLILVASMATGCASSSMVDSAQQEMVTPSADKAQVIFLRASFVGSAIQAVVYDTTDGGAEFIGILSNGKKLAYMVDPGEHVFMVVSEAADFMQANLEGGKTYYAMVTPRMGAWRARFSLYPVRNGAPGEFQYNSSEFQEWLSENRFSENTEASLAWAEDNRDSVLNKQREYWAVWQQKGDAAIAERTLNPDDGV